MLSSEIIDYGAIQRLGEKILERSLKMAAKFVRITSNAPITLIQMTDDHYIFIHSSNLDIFIERTRLPYDPDRLREGFRKIIENG